MSMTEENRRDVVAYRRKPKQDDSEQSEGTKDKKT